jgi:hypothetical protein
MHELLSSHGLSRVAGAPSQLREATSGLGTALTAALRIEVVHERSADREAAEEARATARGSLAVGLDDLVERVHGVAQLGRLVRELTARLGQLRLQQRVSRGMTARAAPAATATPGLLGELPAELARLMGDTATDLTGFVRDEPTDLACFLRNTTTCVAGFGGDPTAELAGAVRDTATGLSGSLRNSATDLAGLTGDTPAGMFGGTAEAGGGILGAVRQRLRDVPGCLGGAGIPLSAATSKHAHLLPAAGRDKRI